MDEDTDWVKHFMSAPQLTIDYSPADDKFHIHGVTLAHQSGLLNVPGVNPPRKGTTYWNAAARYAQIVAIGNMYPVGYTQAAIDKFTLLATTVEACKTLRTVGLDDSSETFVMQALAKYGIAPKHNQCAAIAHLATAERAALFSEPGVGKTIVSAGALKLYDVGATLVVCPKSVLYNWHRELLRFGVDSLVFDGTAAKRQKMMETFDPAVTPVLITSYGIARGASRIAGYGATKLKRCNECGGHQDIPEKKCETHERWLNTIEWDCIIVDEAHRIREATNVQTRAIWELASHTRYAWLLTGTPIEQRADEMWSLLHTIDPAEHPSSSKYKTRYMLSLPTHWGPDEIVGLNPQTKPEFDEVTQWRWRRDVKVGMPETVYEVRTTELGAKNGKAYRQMRDQMMAELANASGDGTSVITAENAMVKHGRLRQMANAECVLDDDGELRMVNNSEKLDLFEDTLEDFPEPTIAWFSSRQLLNIASDRLLAKGIAHGVIHGGVSGKDRDDTVAAFQNGTIDLLLLNPQAGGEGITLTRARVAIWVMRPDSSILTEQADNRRARYGVEHDELLDIDLIVLGTVEEDQLPKLAEKQANAAEVIG